MVPATYSYCRYICLHKELWWQQIRSHTTHSYFLAPLNLTTHLHKNRHLLHLRNERLPRAFPSTLHIHPSCRYRPLISLSEQYKLTSKNCGNPRYVKRKFECPHEHFVSKLLVYVRPSLATAFHVHTKRKNRFIYLTVWESGWDDSGIWTDFQQSSYWTYLVILNQSIISQLFKDSLFCGTESSSQLRAS